jgi:hypothetical protein
LKFTAAPSFSVCAPISVASMSITIRSGRTPNSHARSRARARAVRTASSNPGSFAIRSTSRNAVESDATGPNNGC